MSLSQLCLSASASSAAQRVPREQSYGQQFPPQTARCLRVPSSLLTPPLWDFPCAPHPKPLMFTSWCSWAAGRQLGHLLWRLQPSFLLSQRHFPLCAGESRAHSPVQGGQGWLQKQRCSSTRQKQCKGGYTYSDAKLNLYRKSHSNCMILKSPIWSFQSENSRLVTWMQKVAKKLQWQQDQAKQRLYFTERHSKRYMNYLVSTHKATAPYNHPSL